MKFSLMRKIDLYRGLPCCYLLALIYKFRGKIKKKSSKPEALKKVLIIKFLGFRSIILTIPLTAELKK